MATASAIHSTIARALNTSDVEAFPSGEPRISHRRLSDSLGYGEAHKFSHLINRHIDILTRFSEVPSTMDETSPKGGRPGKTYWLTKKQCLYICTKAETPNATEVAIQMVDVFDAYMAGRTVQRPEPRHSAPARKTATLHVGRRDVTVDLSDFWIGPRDEAVVIDHLGHMTIIHGPLSPQPGYSSWLGARACLGPMKPGRSPGTYVSELVAVVGRIVSSDKP